MKLLDIADEIQHALNSEDPVFRHTDGFYNLAEEMVNVMLDFPEKPANFKPITFKKFNAYDNVVCVSGGMDSTVMYELNRQVKNTAYIYLDYGQAYAEKELAACQAIGIHPLIKINRKLEFKGDWKHIVPSRNFVILSYAANMVNHEGTIWLGAVSGESAPDKGDKSDLFFRLFEEYVWRTQRKKVSIHTLKAHTKNDWLKWYLNTTFRTDILNTVTCFEGTKKHCGRCQACARKWIAMRYCNVAEEFYDIFEVDPWVGAKQHFDKYKVSLQKCLDNEDFSHYTRERCEQDLQVIWDYEDSLRDKGKSGSA